MKIPKKIVLTAVLLIFAGGLCSYKLMSDRGLPNDLAGNYVSVMPNYVERQLILKTNNIKGAYFADEKVRKICLNKDFTQKIIFYSTKGDSAISKGTWKVKNDSLILHFPERDFNICLTRLQFTNKLYYISNLVRCKDSVAVKEVNAFKKVK